MLNITKDNFRDYINEIWFNNLPEEWKSFWRHLHHNDMSRYISINSSIEFISKCLRNPLEYKRFSIIDLYEYIFNYEKVSLHIDFMGNSSLIGLEYCINLNYLDCFNCNLSSLEGIENCINLRTLKCGCNNLTSLKGLKNCFNLKYLDCGGNNFNNINAIYPHIRNAYNLDRLVIKKLDQHSKLILKLIFKEALYYD